MLHACAHLLDSTNKDRGLAPFDDDVPDSRSQTLTMLAPSIAPQDSLAYARDVLVDVDSLLQDTHSLASTQLLCLSPPLHAPPQYSPAAASSAALASVMNAPIASREPSRQPVESSKSTIKPQAPPTRQTPPIRPPRPSRPLYPPPDRYQARYQAYLAGCALSSVSDDSDEGYYEADTRRFTSHFSVTTTSTSRYVEVERPPTDAGVQLPRDSVHSGLSAWSTLRDAERDICFNVPLECGRKLRKGRPRAIPERTPSPASSKSSSSGAASPAEVLARVHYNHVVTASEPESDISGSPPPSKGRKPKTSTASSVIAVLPHLPSPETASRRAKTLLHRISRRRPEGDDERWVCIEVRHKVTQRVVGVEA